jgi:hypothetical protein
MYYLQIHPTADPMFPEPGEFIAMIFTPILTLVILWEVIIYIKNINWKAHINSMRLKMRQSDVAAE